MLETFEANLAQSQQEEMKNQKAFEDLKAAKEAEIAAGQEQIDKKTGELADTDEKNAQAKEDMEDTKKSLAADEQFLLVLKDKCARRTKSGKKGRKHVSSRWRQCRKLSRSSAEMMLTTYLLVHSTQRFCKLPLA